MFLKWHDKKHNPLNKYYVFIVAAIISVVSGMDGKVQDLFLIGGNNYFPSYYIANNMVLCILYDFVLLLTLIFILRLVWTNIRIQRHKYWVALKTETYLTIADDSLISKWHDTISETKFSSIYDCVNVNGYCYLIITPGSIYTIPKNCDENIKFIELLGTKINIRQEH